MNHTHRSSKFSHRKFTNNRIFYSQLYRDPASRGSVACTLYADCPTDRQVRLTVRRTVHPNVRVMVQRAHQYIVHYTDTSTDCLRTAPHTLNRVYTMGSSVSPSVYTRYYTKYLKLQCGRRIIMLLSRRLFDLQQSACFRPRKTGSFIKISRQR